MELLTPALRQRLPLLASQQEEGDPLCCCHFYLPDTDWDWYPIEFESIEIFSGWSRTMVEELTTFSLSELRVLRGLCGMPVPRDVSFHPMPLSQVKKRHASLTGASRQEGVLQEAPSKDLRMGLTPQNPARSACGNLLPADPQRLSPFLD